MKLDEDDDFISMKKTPLPVGVISKITNEYVIPIDEVVQEPSYYRDAAHMISMADEDDVVRYKINSTGGMLSGLISLLDANASTRSTTVAHIIGDCHSAASILALSCDEVIVGPYATMLCHTVRYGFAGKGADMEAHVQHVTSNTEELIRGTYFGFLSEEEIVDLLKGRELYLNSSQIVERLKTRQTILDSLINED